MSYSESSKKCGAFPGITLSYFAVIRSSAEGIKQKV